MTIKHVTRRDSATAILRKLGVKTADYKHFIRDSDVGGFDVNVAGAKSHVETYEMASKVNDAIAAKAKTFAEAVGATETKAPSKRKPKVEKAVKAKLEARVAKRAKPTKANGEITVSTFARALIRAGDDNEAVWKKLVAKFNLDDKKRGYPSWYRNQLRKQGEKV